MFKAQNNNGYLHAFDSLRGLALLGVLFYHLDPGHAPNGYLGVVTFFVLAGFLCMRKTMHHPTERFRLSDIFANFSTRVAKIYPPMLLMLFAVSLLMLIFFPEFLDHFAYSLRSSLLSVNNIAQILRGESYFEGAGILKPITHLWALSLELQFYLLFSLTVHVFYRPRAKSLWLSQFLIFSFISVLLAYFLYTPGQDPSRVYYGTDTRLYSFLGGAALALLLCDREPSLPSTTLRDFLSVLLLLVLTAAYFIPLNTDFMMRFALPLYTLLALLWISLNLSKDSLMARVSRRGFFPWLASRSYWIYLWHFPFIRFCERFFAHVSVNAWLILMLELSGSVFISEWSYILEKTVRERGKMAEDGGRSANSPMVAAKGKGKKITTGVALLLAAVLLLLPWHWLAAMRGEDPLKLTKASIEKREEEMARERSLRRSVSEGEIRVSRPNDESSAISVETSVRSEERATSQPRADVTRESQFRLKLPEGTELNEEELFQYEAVVGDIKSFNYLGGDYQVDLEAYARYRSLELSMIGDSVSVIASYFARPYLPGLILDALSNRQMKDAWDVYEDLSANGEMRDLLILALGTNGDVNHEDIEKVYRAHEGRPLLLVSIILPYAMQEQMRNESLRSFAAAHKNIWLVEWNLNAKDYPNFFQEDSIHPSEQGCKAFWQLITARIVTICQEAADWEIGVSATSAVKP